MNALSCLAFAKLLQSKVTNFLLDFAHFALVAHIFGLGKYIGIS